MRDEKGNTKNCVSSESARREARCLRRACLPLTLRNPIQPLSGRRLRSRLPSASGRQVNV